MYLLSALLRLPITTDTHDTLGEVADVVVENHHQYPIVKGLLTKTPKNTVYIPLGDIVSIGKNEITLKKTIALRSWKRGEHELALVKNLLDKQIFDIDNIRVVRVNDLRLAKIQGTLSLIGIEIGMGALLRRLGVPSALTRMLRPEIIDWQSVECVEGHAGGLKLKTPYAKLTTLHPADIANLIEHLSLHESSDIIEHLDPATAAEVLAEVTPKYKDVLLEQIDPKNLSDVLEEMPSDEAADVLQDLSKGKQGKVMRQLESTTSKVLTELARYDNEHAGSLMTTEYLAVPVGTTATQTIDYIRKKSDEHPAIYHIFALDEERRLVGVVSMRTLLLAEGRTRMKDMMGKVVATVQPESTVQEALHILTKYNLLSVAVVNEEHRLQGIITIDDAMRHLVPNA